MKAGTPFRAAMMMAAAMASVMQATAGNYAAQQAAMKDLGPYEGRGKGRAKLHDNGGTKSHQRGAMKKRNQVKHRAACRG